MPISQIVKQFCKDCGAVAKEKSRLDLGSLKLITLTCGHVTTEDVITSEVNSYEELQSVDGSMKLMDFQIEGVKFAEKANCRVLIADEQGLGKTIEALALLKLHKAELFPCVVATKATIKVQWMHQIHKWIPDAKVQPLFSGKEIAVPGFDVYITSYAMLADENVWQAFEFVPSSKPKTLILDECQSITNHLAKRSKGAQRMGADCEYIIGLSGTPIRNHAGEYFTILNLIQPKLFPEYRAFLRDHCDSYDTFYATKVGGLKDPDHFHEFTKDFIIRRTQEQVLPDLFRLQQPRKFHHVELDRRVHTTYDRLLKELEELMYSDESGFNLAGQRLAIMNRMRQVTGISKAIECSEYISEFLLSTNRKIAVFVHHHAAADLLESKVNQYLEAGGWNKCTLVKAGDDSSAKIRDFNDPKSRVILCSGLGAGEGMDGLQLVCSDMVILERFWNPAAEEQIEKRIARMGQTKPTNIVYMIASGTIDEFFTDLVEQKRGIVASTLDNKELNWDESSLLNELAKILVTKGKKAWKF